MAFGIWDFYLPPRASTCRKKKKKNWKKGATVAVDLSPRPPLCSPSAADARRQPAVVIAIKWREKGGSGEEEEKTKAGEEEDREEEGAGERGRQSERWGSPPLSSRTTTPH